MDSGIIPLNTEGNWTASDALWAASGEVSPDDCVIVVVRRKVNTEVRMYCGGQELTNERAVFMAQHIIKMAMSND